MHGTSYDQDTVCEEQMASESAKLRSAALQTSRSLKPVYPHVVFLRLQAGPILSKLPNAIPPVATAPAILDALLRT